MLNINILHVSIQIYAIVWYSSPVTERTKLLAALKVALQYVSRISSPCYQASLLDAVQFPRSLSLSQESKSRCLVISES
jgi:hypothetical protein